MTLRVRPWLVLRRYCGCLHSSAHVPVGEPVSTPHQVRGRLRRNMRLQEIEEEAERGNRLPASALGVEQRRDDGLPFRVERPRRDWLFRLPIPIGGVAAIALGPV